MRWDNQEESSNVEDRRGWGGTGVALGGGGGLIVLLIALFLGINPKQLPIPQSNTEAPRHSTAKRDPAEERLAHFAKVIFRDTETVWTDRFARLGREYQMPTLVLFSGAAQSACGFAQSAVGPFYCPSDARVYLDLSFFQDMQDKLGAPGEFARAYVIAHEVGHHVQRLLGFAPGRTRSNQESVRTELQADFLAGVWAHDGQEKFKFLEDGDLDSALNAAFQIGDDRLQKKSRGYVVPDSFTHGTSAQRMAAFKEGFESGDLRLARKYFQEPFNAVGE